MKLYLLYYDENTGAREEWNTFYTPCEIYSSDELRHRRIEELKTAINEDGNPVDYGFHTEEVVLDEKQN